jgi:heme/copper-type cytochrome/quinol oxidase subunit 2
VVAFAVFIGAYVLCAASGDQFGATLLWWIAMFDLMFLIIDFVLLVIFLSLYVLFQFRPENQPVSDVEDETKRPSP